MFILIWTYRPVRARSGDGFFNCPRCRDRQPAQLVVIRLRPYLYGLIPWGLGDRVEGGPELYWCKNCHGEFANDGSHGYDFGVNYAASPDWSCFKCGCRIPHDQLECLSCGWNFYTGQYRQSG